MPDIRILLAEDQTLLRQGLRTILDLEAGSGGGGGGRRRRGGGAEAMRLRPDIVLMDIQMPEPQRRGGDRADHRGLSRDAGDRR